MIPRIVIVLLGFAILFAFVGAGVGFVFGNLAPAAVRSAFPAIGNNLNPPTSGGIAAETVRAAVGAGLASGAVIGVACGALAVMLETWLRTKGIAER